MTKVKQKKILELGGEGYTIVEKEEKKQKEESASFLYQASEIGFSIALPISLGALAGVWLDNKFSSHPKFTLSLLFGGIFFAFTNLFILVKKVSERRKK